jgi:hypothetical protein
MQIELVPEVLDAPLGYGVYTHAQLKEAAEAMLKSADYLETFGDPSKSTAEDKQTARDVLLNKQPISAIQNTATAQHLRALLSEYDMEVVKTAVQIRNFVTNSLIEEAAPGSKTRIRALELLGKISEVGLFTERSEVTVKHQTTVELEQKVRDKIASLISKKTTAQDITPREASPETIHNRISELTDIIVARPNNATER